jgi:GntR family transcriptional regulator
MTDLVEEIAGERFVYSQDSIEASLADEVEADLLGIEIEAPVLVLNGLAYFVNNRPARKTKSIFRGDRFKFILGEPKHLMPKFKLPIDFSKT